MNSVNLIGNLTRDPETRFTPQNKQVCNFGIAINEGKDRVTFVDVECWEKTAEIAGKYWHKGKQIGLSGRLQFDQWTDKEGGKRSKLKVVAERVYFVGPKDQGDKQQSEQSGPQSYSQPGLHTALDDSDVPF